MGSDAGLKKKMSAPSLHGLLPTQKKFLPALGVIACFVVFLVIRMSLSGVPVEEEPVHDVLGMEFHHERLQIYESSAHAEDLAWRHDLEHRPIIAVDRSWIWGVSEKYPMVLEGNIKAMCKPATARDFNPFYGWYFFFWNLFSHRPMRMYTPSVPLYDVNLMTEEWVSFVGMRAQGASEIVAYHLDSVLDYRRKPPLASRLVSNKQLYFYGDVHNPRPDSPYEKKEHQWKERSGITGFIANVIERYLTPAYPVAVSMHSWVEMKGTAPNTMVGKILMQLERSPTMIRQHLRAVLDVSDTIVFDWLMDDHDRKQDHNWMSFHERLLIWDSGLALRHGPFAAGVDGSQGCGDILCGTHRFMHEIENPAWTDSIKAKPDFDPESNKYCNRICFFRSETIEHLRAMGPTAEHEHRLGARMRQSLLLDAVGSELMELGVYRVKRGRNKNKQRRYYADNFFTGFDRKLAMLLEHVDACVEQHGKDRVLVEY